MRRVLLIAAVLIGIIAGALITSGASNGSGGSYQVRAIFDDGAFAVTGEDVRIAGAPVGTIGSLDVCTPRSAPCPPGTLNRAAVTFTITRPGFFPFHTNAFCAIRPQSLIGEKYVDCNPGTASAPPLPRIQSGPGAGSYLLPVTHTSSPVDTDLVNDIYRDPVRQQFTLILNELGTGLAARGSDLNDVIRRANPALQYTDDVLKILARQNRQLAQLAHDSNAVLTPLARMRQQIQSFVIHANITSVASAARANDISRGLALLPGFLQQARPLEADLGELADQGTPLFNSLAQAGPSLARQYQNLVPFAAVARTSLIELGKTSAEQQPLLLKTIPLARRLLRLGNASTPTATLLDRLTSSLNTTGAIEDLMRVFFYGTTATNGFDSTGHFIRTEALVGGCTGFVQVPAAVCSANFTHTGAAADVASLPRTAAEAAIVRSARKSRSVEKTRHVLTGLLSYLIGGSP